MSFEYWNANFTPTGDMNSSAYISYATENEADLFLAVDAYRATAWTALNATQKAQRLISATRRIDLLSFIGERTDPEQRTKFPRTGLNIDGQELSSTTIPQAVQDATILLAGTSAINANATRIQPAQDKSISKVKAGDVQVEYHSPTEVIQAQNTLEIPDPDAWHLLLPFIIGDAPSIEFYDFEDKNFSNIDFAFRRAEGY